MSKIKTINVIKILGGFFANVTSFEDTKKGRTEAEKYFIETINNDFFQDIELDEESIKFIMSEKIAGNGSGDSYMLVESI